MKKIYLLFIAILIFTGCNKEEKRMKGIINISGAWAMYPIVVEWGYKFNEKYPDIKVNVSAGGAGKGMSDVLHNMVEIGMISRDIFDEEIKKGAWPIMITKDAVVPTVNINNPYIDNIVKHGMTKNDFIDIWISGDLTNWNEKYNNKNENKINIYTRSDACGAAKTWAKYLGMSQEDLKGIGVYADPGLVEAVSKDKFGLGFNNINYVYDIETKKFIDGIRVLPIDLNENGLIDNEENIYEIRDDLVNAINLNIYPSPPARILYFVCNGKPENKIVVEFIKWTLTDGQQYIDRYGYIKLSDDILLQELQKIKKK